MSAISPCRDIEIKHYVSRHKDLMKRFTESLKTQRQISNFLVFGVCFW